MCKAFLLGIPGLQSIVNLGCGSRSRERAQDAAPAAAAGHRAESGEPGADQEATVAHDDRKCAPYDQLPEQLNCTKEGGRKAIR